MTTIRAWEKYLTSSAQIALVRPAALTSSQRQRFGTNPNPLFVKGRKCIKIIDDSLFSHCLFEYARHPNELARSNWLLQRIRENYIPRTKKFKLSIDGRDVCAFAFRTIYGITKTRFYDIRKICLKGQVAVITHGNALRPYLRPRTDLSATWIHYFGVTFCEFMPHLNIMYLPTGLTKEDVFDLFIDSMTKKFPDAERDEFPKRSLFLSILHQRYPFIKVARKCRLGRCHDCVFYDLKLTDDSLPKEEKEALRKTKAKHLNSVMAERAAYKEVSREAAMPDSKTLSLIFDKGNGPRIPHSAKFPKNWATAKRFKSGLWGLIDHSNMKKVLIPHMSEYPDDPNFTLSVFYDYLVNVRRTMKGGFPAYLHLQVDNCAKENKNNWMLALLSTLVEKNLFKIIVLEFLPPGHTHEDIDALFTPVSNGATSYNAFTPNEFASSFLKSCYRHHKNNPKILSFPKVYDWKSFFNPCMRRIEGITKYRSFKFEVLSLRFY
jgi:hypothetical protein